MKRVRTELDPDTTDRWAVRQYHRQRADERIAHRRQLRHDVVGWTLVVAYTVLLVAAFYLVLLGIGWVASTH